MRIFLMSLLLLVTSHTYGQQYYTISGTVVDADNNSVPVGDVMLFQKKEGHLFKYATLQDGAFSFEEVPVGNYTLRVNCIGFQEEERLLELSGNRRLNFSLRTKVTELDEVAVIAAKPLVINKNGNMKIDVTNPIFAAIPEPMELLARFPGIQVSADRQSLVVLGKGSPLIYIGNQRISLEEFNALAVDRIESVEIVRNPSAKYEADGRAVLLVTRKRVETEGSTLGFKETLSMKQNFNNYNGLNVNVKKNKWTLQGTLGYNILQTWESNSFVFEIPAEELYSDYLVLIDKNDREQLNLGLGLFYEINKTDYWSLSATGKLQDDHFRIDTNTFLRQGASEDLVDTETFNETNKDFISVNFNYNKLLKEDLSLFTGMQYSSFLQALQTNIFNNYNSSGFMVSQNRFQKYRLNALAYRLDITKTFDGAEILEWGINLSEARANALTEIDFFEPLSEARFAFDYAERLFAGYAQRSGDIGSKLNYSMGLRAEYNKVEGEVGQAAAPIVEREGFVLFPKALLNIALDSTKSLAFNYAKNIRRPNYSRASSITSFINPLLEGAGNVNLRPTIIDELSAVFQRKKTTLTASYSRSKYPAYFTIAYDTENERAVLSQRNLDRESFLDLSLNMPFTRGRWTSSNYISVSYRKIQDATALIAKARPYGYFYTNHQYKLGKTTTVGFGGWALTKRSEGIFNRNAMVVLEASIAKTLFKKLHCSVRFNDITRAMNFRESYAIGGVNANGVYFADGKEIALSLKYTFAKGKAGAYKNKNVDEGLDRIR